MDRSGKLEECIREESFREMHSRLGDSQSLEEIRERNSGKRHCIFLRQDPEACRCFPVEWAESQGIIPKGTVRIGSPCPNNPYFRHRREFEELEREAQLLEFGLWLNSYVELGNRIDPEGVSPGAYVIARMIRSHVQAQQRAIMPLIPIGKENHGGTIP